MAVAAWRPWPTQSPTISARRCVVELDEVVPVAADREAVGGAAT